MNGVYIFTVIPSWHIRATGHPISPGGGLIDGTVGYSR
jgi:hypothetical protein